MQDLVKKMQGKGQKWAKMQDNPAKLGTVSKYDLNCCLYLTLYLILWWFPIFLLLAYPGYPSYEYPQIILYYPSYIDHCKLAEG